MARGGLNDDDDGDQSIVALARRPVLQQRNNETPESPAALAEPAPASAPASTGGNGQAPAAAALVPAPGPEPASEPPLAPAASLAASPSLAPERRSLGGRPRNPEPRVLLRATVTKPNAEWVEEKWRTQMRADGSRYANMGEFMDELLTLARTRTGA
jgi:hypothetical protein